MWLWILPCLAMSCGDLSRLICVVSLSYPCRGLNWTSFPTEARRLGSCWACRCNLKPRGHAATASPGTAYHLHHLYHLHLCHSVSLCVSLCPAYSDNPISGIDDASAHLTLKCIGMHWISLIFSSLNIVFPLYISVHWRSVAQIAAMTCQKSGNCADCLRRRVFGAHRRQKGQALPSVTWLRFG